MKEQILKILPLYRWHPEVAIRYLPIVDEIKKMDSVTILEVGSGGLGIAPYLNREVTGIDSDFSGPTHPLLKRIKGTGEKLPFADKSFGVVISVDILEHVPQKNREKVITEMIRVAQKEVIIATPCGNDSEKQDRVLSEIYKRKFGEDYQFLKEQLEYGLPDAKEVLSILKKLTGNKIEINVVGNENLQVRKFLMTGWMTKNILADIFYRKLLLAFIPIFQLVNSGPFYRKIFYARINK